MAEILLYGVIGDSFDKLDAATVTSAVRESTGPLSVRINSPGGYVMEGLAIIEALRSYPGKVTMHIDGLAASMASAIAMVGADVIMAESALMMIHKPWDSSIGNADDLRRDAAKLDRVEAQLINIYAKRTGLAADRLATMLAAETWFTPEEALAQGFVTAISQPLKLAAMARATGYGFRHLPIRLQQQETPMTGTPAPSPTVLDPVAVERIRIGTITALCSKHRLPDHFRQGMIDRGLSLDEARGQILDALAAQGDAANIGHSAGITGGHQSLDDPSVHGAAIRDALFAKISGKPASGTAAEMQSMSVVDMARDWLSRRGARDVLRMSADRVINIAMAGDGGGRGASWGFRADIGAPHTTSDFPDLVAGAAEKYLVERYKLQESQLKQLARQTSRSNFLTQYGVTLDGIGALDQVAESAEFKNRTISTRTEGYGLKTYGNMFTVSRQMLANDALGALADILNIMASEAAETEAVVLASIINSYVMRDNKQFFHPDHKNLAAVGGAPSIMTLDAGRLAMRAQRTEAGRLIDANPKFLLVPVQLQTAAETLVASTIVPNTTADVNPFAGKLTPVAEPRLASATAWYLFGDPELSAALEYAYLNGQTAPFTDSQEGWRVDGTEYKVRHDFGAGVIDYRMAWKNPGA